ncbi:hypothetical protein L1887_40758 [Cichorium endivia]|nr:hypothetical protein L1887_40758 [Cichorium endivia]
MAEQAEIRADIQRLESIILRHFGAETGGYDEAGPSGTHHDSESYFLITIICQTVIVAEGVAQRKCGVTVPLHLCYAGVFTAAP